MFKLLATAYLFLWIGLAVSDINTELPSAHFGGWDALGIAFIFAISTIFGYLAGREDN